LISRVSEESLEGDQGLDELQFEIDKSSSLGEEGTQFEERVVGGKGSLIPREFFERGERRRTTSRDAHISREEESMHSKTITDI
jgi:hypothetical protein